MARARRARNRRYEIAMRHRITPEVVAKVRELAARGFLESQIARLCCISQSSVAVITANSGCMPKGIFPSAEEQEQRRIEDEKEQARQEERLAHAVADGSACLEKGCPFPAVLDGRCRQHFRDSVATLSLLPSNLPNAFDYAIGSDLRGPRTPRGAK